jgi:hypothetical protein
MANIYIKDMFNISRNKKIWVKNNKGWFICLHVQQRLKIPIITSVGEINALVYMAGCIN